MPHHEQYKSLWSNDKSAVFYAIEARQPDGLWWLEYDAFADVCLELSDGKNEQWHIRAYSDAKTAGLRMASFKQQYGYTSVRISRIPLPQCIADARLNNKAWKEREQARFDSGEYTRLPFYDCDSFSMRHDRLEHYAHVSKEKPQLVAFTESAEKGIQDIQKRMSPSKYLREYYPDLGRELIRILVDQYETVYPGDYTLKLYTTPDEFEEQYTLFGEYNGVSSCMTGETGNFCTDGIHPARVYAAGDLSLAVLSDEDHPVARCLVWPDKGLFGRIYGNESAMTNKLLSRGYTVYEGNNTALQGARLLKIPFDSGHVMPYIDGCCSYGNHEDGKHFCIKGNAGNAGYTNGLDFDPDEDRTTCDCCEESYDADNGGGTVHTRRGEEYWCDYCFENNTFYCVASDNTYSERCDRIVLDNGDFVAVENMGGDYFECALTSVWCHIDDSVGYYDGDEDQMICQRAVDKYDLLHHEDTNSWYKPEDYPKTEEESDQPELALEVA
jgi:hypothetical protein